MDKEKPGIVKYKRLKLGGSQAYDRSVDELQFQSRYISKGINLQDMLALTGNLFVLVSCTNVT
jgi:hypothetical protein